MRVRGIDRFRGLAIVLMVFFTLLYWFDSPLPDILVHNEPQSFHIGDIILPMFLFASGMSLVFFRRKREEKGRMGYWLDVFERAGKLLMVWFFLSPFTAGFLGMDEIMLSVLLFIPCAFLVRQPDDFVLAVAAAPIIAYLALAQMGMLPAFDDPYLGGYAAAPFYLPVMLAGILAGRRMDELPKLIAIAAIASLILLLFAPPYKLSASPSLMVISVAISLAIFGLVRHMDIRPLEYLGREPLRYWIMMLAILLIPLDLAVLASGSMKAPAADWPLAVAFSSAGVLYLYAASRLLDIALSFAIGRRQGNKERGAEASAMGNIYDDVPADFYESSLHSANPITRHYHGSRYETIRRFVSAGYRKGMSIVDIGCGSSRWNEGKLPVVGLDQNIRMLKYGIAKGFLESARECDLRVLPLPAGDSEFDFAVVSEVLEHLDEPGLIVAEAARALKAGGTIIVTVPNDSGLSLWRVLFEANCFLLGDLLGDEYYRNRCGHVQHFSQKDIEELLEKNGFAVVKRRISLLNIAIAARKKRGGRLNRRKRR